MATNVLPQVLVFPLEDENQATGWLACSHGLGQTKGQQTNWTFTGSRVLLDCRPMAWRRYSSEAYTYEPGTGFMTTKGREEQRQKGSKYAYDGAGHLVYAFRDSPQRGARASTHFTYDHENALMVEQTIKPRQPSRTVLHFNQWWFEVEDGREIEPLLPMLRVDDGEAHWSIVEPDGHALATYDGDGLRTQLDVVGAFGQEIYQEGAYFPLDNFHGGEVQRDHGLMQMGARHVLHRGDGMWMQPEPVLGLGLHDIPLASPGALSGAYAAAQPFSFHDRSGMTPDTVFDVASVLVGAASYDYNKSQGNYGAAALDAFGITVDTIAAIVPGASLGAGFAIHGFRRAIWGSKITTNMSGDPSLTQQADAMAERATEVQNVLESDPIAHKQRTAAALQTDNGVVIGGGKRDLNPAQRDTARVGEILSKDPKKHAEPTTLQTAKDLGLQPRALGASRDFCDDCREAIEEAGGTIIGPRTAIWEESD